MVKMALNPRTGKLFQLTFAAKGGLLQPPLDFGLPDRIIFVKFFMGDSFLGQGIQLVIVRI